MRASLIFLQRFCSSTLPPTRYALNTRLMASPTLSDLRSLQTLHISTFDLINHVTFVSTYIKLGQKQQQHKQTQLINFDSNFQASIKHLILNFQYLSSRTAATFLNLAFKIDPKAASECLKQTHLIKFGIKELNYCLPLLKKYSNKQELKPLYDQSIAFLNSQIQSEDKNAQIFDRTQLALNLQLLHSYKIGSLSVLTKFINYQTLPQTTAVLLFQLSIYVKDRQVSRQLYFKFMQNPIQAQTAVSLISVLQNGNHPNHKLALKCLSELENAAEHPKMSQKQEEFLTLTRPLENLPLMKLPYVLKYMADNKLLRLDALDVIQSTVLNNCHTLLQNQLTYFIRYRTLLYQKLMDEANSLPDKARMKQIQSMRRHNLKFISALLRFFPNSDVKALSVFVFAATKPYQTNPQLHQTLVDMALKHDLKELPQLITTLVYLVSKGKKKAMLLQKISLKGYKTQMEGSQHFKPSDQQ